MVLIILLILFSLSACRDEVSGDLFERQITDGAKILWEEGLRDDQQFLPYRPLPDLNPLPISNQFIVQDWLKELQFYQQGAPLKPLLMVPFSAPIDLQALITKQQDDVLVNDAIYLIDATEGTEQYLQAIPLDFGDSLKAHVPFTSMTFPFLAEYLAPTQLSLFSEDELKNQTKILENQSLLNIKGDAESRVYWLSFKPLLPLLPNHRYLVVISGDIQDLNQKYISSPAHTHPIDQRDEIEKISSVFNLYGINRVAFSWMFKTTNPFDLISELQALVYQKGENQDVIKPMNPMLTNIETWTANPECLGLKSNQSDQNCLDTSALLPQNALLSIYEALAESEGLSEAQSKALGNQLQSTQGLWMGEFSGWTYLPHLKSTQYEAKINPGLKIKPAIGKDFEGNRWGFYCFLPKEGKIYDAFGVEKNKQSPFPTVFWQIDISEHWTSLFKVAPYFNQVGYALCGLEGMMANEIPYQENFSLSFLRNWNEQKSQGNISDDLLRGNIESAFDAFAQKKKFLSSDLLPWEKDLTGRELNHALAQLQFIEVLKQSEMGKKLNLAQRIGFGGTGVGANVALISAVLYPSTSMLVTVDLSSTALELSLTSAQPEDQLPTLQRLTGSWLKLIQNTNGTYQLSMLVPQIETAGTSIKTILIDDQITITDQTSIYVKVGEHTRLSQKLKATASQLLHFPAQEGEVFEISFLTGRQLKKISTFKQAFEFKGKNYPSQTKLFAFYDGVGAPLSSEMLKEAIWISDIRQQEDHPITYLPFLNQRLYTQGYLSTALTQSWTDQQKLDAQTQIPTLHFHHLGNQKSTTALSFKLWDAQGLLDIQEPLIFDLSPRAFLMQSNAVNSTRTIQSAQNNLLDLDNVDQYKDDYPTIDDTFELRLTKKEQDHLYALRFPLRPYEQGQMHGLRYADLLNTHYSYDLYMLQQMSLFYLAQGKSNQLKSLDEPCLFFKIFDVEACPFNQNIK